MFLGKKYVKQYTVILKGDMKHLKIWPDVINNFLPQTRYGPEFKYEIDQYLVDEQC